MSGRVVVDIKADDEWLAVNIHAECEAATRSEAIVVAYVVGYAKAAAELAKAEIEGRGRKNGGEGRGRKNGGEA